MEHLHEVDNMIKSRAQAWARPGKVGLEFDDLYQEGVILLSKIEMQYKEDSGVKFSTWFYRCLTNHYSMLYRKDANNPHVSLNTLLESGAHFVESFTLPMKSYLEDLSTDARICAELALNGHNTKSDIREYLGKHGWDYNRVLNAFKELKVYLA